MVPGLHQQYILESNDEKKVVLDDDSLFPYFCFYLKKVVAVCTQEKKGLDVSLS